MRTYALDHPGVMEETRLIILHCIWMAAKATTTGGRGRSLGRREEREGGCCTFFDNAYGERKTSRLQGDLKCRKNGH